MRWASPWIPLGTNPLLVFVGSGVMARCLTLWRVGEGPATVPIQRLIYERVFASWAGPFPGSLAYAVCFVLVWMAIAQWLHRTGWRIRA
jgi:predicted acyltransferase